jgi:amino-acid N-acetyltransferase
MTNTLSIVPAEARYAGAIKEILSNEKLPVSDLPADLKNFFVATDNGRIVGSIGLEVYGKYGLLRSLAVKPEYRNMKIARELMNKLEENARQSGLKAIYLLTEKASVYFEQKGFKIIQRNEAPADLQQSSEFTHTCPQSAIAMVKNIQ